MDSLRSLLPNVLRKRGLYAHASATLVTYQAQRWLEQELPAFKGAIAATRFANAVLSLTCTNSIAAQECHQLLPSLKEFLARECPDAALSEIRIVRGKQ